MFKRAMTILAFACALALAGCSSNSEVRSGSLSERTGDDDGDVQVTLAECPAAVQTTIAQHVGNGSINEIERAPNGDYEVDANGADGQFEFVVGPDGLYKGPEGDDDDDDDDDGPDDDD